MKKLRFDLIVLIYGCLFFITVQLYTNFALITAKTCLTIILLSTVMLAIFSFIKKAESKQFNAKTNKFKVPFIIILIVVHSLKRFDVISSNLAINVLAFCLLLSVLYAFYKTRKQAS